MPFEPDVTQFDRTVQFITSSFHVLPLQEAVERLREHRLPPASACITFDDGYADNYTVALPVLERYGASATFFIATRFLDGGRMWNDTIVEALRHTSRSVLSREVLELPQVPDLELTSMTARWKAAERIIHAVKHVPQPERDRLTDRLQDWAQCRLPQDLMMSSEQVRSMSNRGMVIGAHTLTHPIMIRLSDEQARREVAESRAELNDLLGHPVELFAYPNGRPGLDYGPRDVQLVRELGFKAAVSTAWGASCGDDDFYQLRRFTPWDRSNGRFGLRVARNLWAVRES